MIPETKEIGEVKESLKKRFELDTSVIERQAKDYAEETSNETSALANTFPYKIDFAQIKNYIDKRKAETELKYKTAFPALKKIPDDVLTKIKLKRLDNQNLKFALPPGGPYYFLDTPFDEFQSGTAYSYKPNGRAEAICKPSNWKTKEMYLKVYAWEEEYPINPAPEKITAYIEAGFIYEIPGSWIKNSGIIEVYPSYDIHGYFDLRAFATAAIPDCEAFVDFKAEVLLMKAYQKYNPLIYGIKMWDLKKHSVTDVRIFDRIDIVTGYSTPKVSMPIITNQTVYVFVGVTMRCSVKGYSSSAVLDLSSGHSQSGSDEEYAGIDGIMIKMP